MAVVLNCASHLLDIQRMPSFVLSISRFVASSALALTLFLKLPDLKSQFLTHVVCAQISGKFSVDGSGNVNFKEEDGIDYAPVTVQLPGGERVPFLFTIKELNAKGSLGGFGGDFVVPSYRGSSFLDPKASHLIRPVASVARTPHWCWSFEKHYLCAHKV